MTMTPDEKKQVAEYRRRLLDRDTFFHLVYVGYGCLAAKEMLAMELTSESWFVAIMGTVAWLAAGFLRWQWQHGSKSR